MSSNGRRYLTHVVTVSASYTIPPGRYDAFLDGISEEEHESYGKRWAWHWRVPEMGPEGSDLEIQRWTSRRFGPDGIASDQARALGVDPTTGVVDLGDLQGRRARLLITLDEAKGRNKVAGVMPPEATPAAASAPVRDPDYLAWKAAMAVADAGEPA